MSDKIFNQRQKKILSLLQLHKEYALSDIKVFFAGLEQPSLATLRRDVVQLRSLGFIKQSGDFKSSRYILSSYGMLHAPVDGHEYCSIDVDKRSGNSAYNFSLFQGINNNIFSREDLDNLNKATRLFIEKSKSASTILKQKELERFVIELSWKSSKIEGNTYTLLDTERLIKEGILAPGHAKDEAIMILNHKKAFQYTISNPGLHRKISIRLIEDIHRLIVEDMGVSYGLRAKPVGVTGSKYMPLSTPSQIKEALEDLCVTIEKLKDPYSRAFMALLGISYIQPFEDGNKRTARLVANAILIAFDCAPLSYRNVDEILYREGMIVFYEKNSIVPMRDIFIRQYLFACEQYLKI